MSAALGALATAACLTGAAAPAAQPPARMSAVGGVRLGLTGVQSALLPGAPAVPADISALSWMVSDLSLIHI